jgi:2-iminoacetate synthase|uniref:[FeFe] hydrogenase H-cluster radical SAM maturase HydG n=1 Tax=candidate division WOR-3 bacterium TaxID=2052148 RepID=A0A7C3UPW3_UNCW3
MDEERQIKEIVDEEEFHNLLADKKSEKKEVREILKKAEEKKGLTLKEVAILLNLRDKELISEMEEVAGRIKREIYGERLVLFAPLYLSNFCVNDCEYCGFHRRNPQPRKKLTFAEIEEEVRTIISMGHKRILVEAGEDPKENPISYIVQAIQKIYETKEGRGEIRRVNVNISATTVENYRRLKEVGIGTYQLFQETYHRPTYERLHKGPKADFVRQIFAHNQAFLAGIDDIGLGVLFGLYDYRFEVLGLVSHAHYLEKRFGIGPHTISVPRFRPAPTVNFSPPYPVSEEELLKIIAILRLAVPYTGMIISTRERAEIREKAFEIGISQTSAGSRTTPGGYTAEETSPQFEISDRRRLDEVVLAMLRKNFIPSFCTACYRSGRTGERFMKMAKPGEIHHLCRPNGLLTFKEYLLDYAGEEVKKLGEEVLNYYLEKVDSGFKEKTKEFLIRIEKGERDIYF